MKITRKQLRRHLLSENVPDLSIQNCRYPGASGTTWGSIVALICDAPMTGNIWGDVVRKVQEDGYLAGRLLLDKNPSTQAVEKIRKAAIRYGLPSSDTADFINSYFRVWQGATTSWGRNLGNRVCAFTLFLIAEELGPGHEDTWKKLERVIQSVVPEWFESDADWGAPDSVNEGKTMKRKLNRNLLRRLVVENLTKESKLSCAEEARELSNSRRFQSSNDQESYMPAEDDDCYAAYKEVFKDDMPEWFELDNGVESEDDDIVAASESMVREQKRSTALSDYDLIDDASTATAEDVDFDLGRLPEESVPGLVPGLEGCSESETDEAEEGMKMTEAASQFENLAFGFNRQAPQPGVETDSQVEESHGTLLRRRYYGRY